MVRHRDRSMSLRLLGLLGAGALILYGLWKPRKRVFISFDYDHDNRYRYLLSALKENAGSAIDFEDVTPKEIRSSDVAAVKRVLTTRIRSATHTLVIVGEYANSPHKDRAKIGERNWQWWEIKKSIEEGKGLIAVKIKKSNAPPASLLRAGAKWALTFDVPAILKAIGDA